MTVEKIYEFLNKKFPVNTAADYDNPGLLIGDKTADAKSAVLALDCTSSAVDLAVKSGAKLIITHHPVIFKGLKSIKKGDLVHTLIENGISVISMHTNMDVCENGVNDALCRTLGLCDVMPVTGYDSLCFRKGTLKEEMSSDDFAAFISKKLNTPVKYVGERSIKTVAVCSGSGSDYTEDALNAGCDALVTSEVKHSIFLDAAEKGFALIDAGHFNTEDVIIEPLKELLEREFPCVSFLTDHSSPIKVYINDRNA